MTNPNTTIYIGVIHNHEIYSSYLVSFSDNLEVIKEYLNNIVETERNYGCDIDSEWFPYEMDYNKLKNIDAVTLEGGEVQIIFDVEIEPNTRYNLMRKVTGINGIISNTSIFKENYHYTRYIR